MWEDDDVKRLIVYIRALNKRPVGESLLATVQPHDGIITSRHWPIGCEAEETGAKPLRRAGFGATLQGF